MISRSIAGLVKIELPSSITVRLCDGGVIYWGAETFTAKHSTFGSVASVRPMSEGVGDEVPALEMVLIPSPTATAGDLVQPGFQTSRVRFWIADYTIATGAVSGTPDLIFDGAIDQCILSVGAQRRDLAMSIVATVERLFQGNIGNSLSPVWHKSIWSGETGHDNATGLSIPIAWGVESPNSAGSFSGGGGGGGGFSRNENVNYL